MEYSPDLCLCYAASGGFNKEQEDLACIKGENLVRKCLLFLFSSMGRIVFLF